MPKNNSAKDHKLIQFIERCLSLSPEVVKELLRQCNREERVEYSSGMLVVACQAEARLDLINMLLAEGVDINKPVGGIFPVHMACINGHKDIVEVLLGAGANIEVLYQQSHETPLQLASENGHKEIVDLLLASGAKIDAPRFDGSTALMAASMNNHVDVVKELLERGANVNTPMQGGTTILLGACGRGHEEVVELLLEANAAIEVSDDEGLTPIYIACANGHTSVVKILLARNVNIEVQTKAGAKPLWRASQKGHTEIVGLLLAAGAEVEGRTNLSSANPLHVASQNGHTEVVKKLLDAGANPESRYDAYETPLFAACKNNRVDIVEILLGAGAEVNTFDNKGTTAFFVACECGFTDVVKILLQAGVKFDDTIKGGATPLMIACQQGHEDIVIELLKKGANVRAKYENGQNALCFACQYNHIDLAKRMLEALLSLEGGISNLSTLDYNYLGKHSELKAFLANKIMKQMDGQDEIDVLSFMPSGFDNEDRKKALREIIKKNLLCWGSVKNLQKYYEALKMYGFDLNIKDRNGKTLLKAACASGDANVILELLKNKSVKKTEEDLKVVEEVFESNKEKINEEQIRSINDVIVRIRKENENFLRKYFPSLLKLVDVDIQKNDESFVLTLRQNESLSQEDFESLKALFQQECACVFHSSVDNGAVLISTETEKPRENSSKVSYENFLLLKKRYFPAEVSVDFTGPVPYFVISTQTLQSPYTEQGKIHWIAAVERELSSVAIMKNSFKDGKFTYKVPVSSLPSSLELPTPFVNSLLETLLQQYCKPSEIIYGKNTFITFLKANTHLLESDSKKSSEIKLSAKSVAYFLHFLLLKILALKNASVRENKEETKFAVVVTEKIAADVFLTMQDAPVNIRDFLNDIEKIKFYYSLHDIELALSGESLGILLRAQDKTELAYIQRDLHEKGYESELKEEGLCMQSIPKAAELKGNFSQSRKRFEKEAKEQQDREAKEKALEEKKNKKQEKQNSPPKETIKRPVMKPAPQQPVSQGKNTSYAKIHRGTYGGENSQGRRSPNDKLDEMKSLLKEVKDYYANFKESLESNQATEAAKVSIYLVTYVKLIPLLTEWYDYLMAKENNHERQDTPFVGKAEDMMALRLAISYSFAQRNMIPLMSATMKWLDLVSFDSENIQRFSAQNIFEESGVDIDDAQDYLSYPDTIVNCLRIIRTCIKESNPTEKDLCDVFKRHPDDFTMVKGLMVGAVQLYRILPKNIQNHSALIPYKPLLTGDLRIVRNVISHNDMDLDVHDIAKIILKIRGVNTQRPQQRSHYSHSGNDANHFSQKRNKARNVGESSNFHSQRNAISK